MSVPTTPGDPEMCLKRTWSRDLFIDYPPPLHAIKYHQWMASLLKPIS